MLRFMDHTCSDLNIGIRLKLDPSSVQALALSALSAVSSEGGSRQPSWPSPSSLTEGRLSGPSSRFSSSSSSSWNAWHAVKLCFGQGTTDNQIWQAHITIISQLSQYDFCCAPLSYHYILLHCFLCYCHVIHHTTTTWVVSADLGCFLGSSKSSGSQSPNSVRRTGSRRRSPQFAHRLDVRDIKQEPKSNKISTNLSADVDLTNIYKTSHPLCETGKIGTLMIAPQSTRSETIWSTEVANLRVCKIAGLSQVAAKGKGCHDQSQTPIPSFRPSPSVAFASETGLHSTFLFQKQVLIVLRKKRNSLFVLFSPAFLLTLTISVPGPDRTVASGLAFWYRGTRRRSRTRLHPTLTTELTWTDINSLEFYRLCAKGIAPLSFRSWFRSFGFRPRCWTLTCWSFDAGIL